MAEREITAVAFYLPQYRPTAYNDEWWGAGFSEWTLLAKASPLFRGHRKPLPGELGFYDLRVADVLSNQWRLAEQYGIDAFCFWHYWFDGRRVLHELPQEMLRDAAVPLRYCLGWANETWTAKWLGRQDDVLIEQTYGGDADDRRHFDSVVEFFLDPRYLRIEGKPVFYIYRPLSHPDLIGFVDRWQALATHAGLPGIYFLGETSLVSLRDANSRAASHLYALDGLVGVDWKRAFHKGSGWTALRRGPLRADYAGAAARFPYLVGECDNAFPCVLTNWDDTPRKGRRGVVLTGRTPTVFEAQVRRAAELVQRLPTSPPLVFVKSWNEWSEGNYLEPDRDNQREYLEAFASGTGKSRKPDVVT